MFKLRTKQNTEMMDILKKANSMRRRLIKGFITNIESKTLNNLNYSDTRKVKRVLIVRPNHRFGNQSLMTALITEVSEIFPNCKIDLFVKGNLASKLSKNYPNIDEIIELPKEPFKNIIQYIKVWLIITHREYDIVINVDNGT